MVGTHQIFFVGLLKAGASLIVASCSDLSLPAMPLPMPSTMKPVLKTCQLCGALGLDNILCRVLHLIYNSTM